MSLLSKALGNAVEFSISEASQNLAKILIPNENVVKAYKLVRDQIIFTNERLILIDVQGVTGSKVSYQSIPYSSIKVFSMESAGTFDLDCEIKLYIQGVHEPISLKFKKGTELETIYMTLSTYSLRDN
jgi:Bacterial PH domain